MGRIGTVSAEHMHTPERRSDESIGKLLPSIIKVPAYHSFNMCSYLTKGRKEKSKEVMDSAWREGN